jgi:hypothetical protein
MYSEGIIINPINGDIIDKMKVLIKDTKEKNKKRRFEVRAIAD